MNASPGTGSRDWEICPFVMKPSTPGQSLVFDDDAPKATTEDNNNETCGQLAGHFQVSVRLHLNRTGKMY